MGKYDIFIADAHIENRDSPCADRFIRFLDRIGGSTRTLFILGDLFDFWFGGNKASFRRYQPILDKLYELSKDGVGIVYLEGNHDIFMGKFFTDVLRADVYSDDAFLYIDGKKCYLTHGDLINYEDTAHIRWMKTLRSRFLVFLMRTVPPFVLTFISKRLSKTSRNYSTEKKTLKDEILREFLSDKKKKGADIVIFAHTHIPINEERDGLRLVNPGAFSDNGSYIRYEGGTFSLENFS